MDVFLLGGAFHKVLAIVVLFLSLTGCNEKPFSKLKQRTYVDPNDAYSISIPKSWKAKTTHGDNGYTELIVRSKGKYDVSLLIHTRLLDEAEKTKDSTALLDLMLNSQIDNLKGSGSTIVNVGKAKEIRAGWPTFVISSLTADREKHVTFWGTVIENRNFGILFVTKNEQHGNELADIAKTLVESIRVP